MERYMTELGSPQTGSAGELGLPSVPKGPLAWETGSLLGMHSGRVVTQHVSVTVSWVPLRASARGHMGSSGAATTPSLALSLGEIKRTNKLTQEARNLRCMTRPGWSVPVWHRRAQPLTAAGVSTPLPPAPVHSTFKNARSPPTLSLGLFSHHRG